MRCPKGLGFGAFLVWKRVDTLPILVRIRVWFSRELRERMNEVIVQLQINKNEIEICEFEMHLKNFLFAL